MRTDFITGYVHGASIENGRDRDLGGMTVKSWDGSTTLASIRIISARRVRSWIGSYMYAYEARTPDGRRYHGRGFGNMMIVNLYPYAT